MSWAPTISANIVFIDFPATLTVKPGEMLNVTWRNAAVDNGTVADMKNFTLSLHALTGQKYTVMTSIAQAAFSSLVRIPINATGGKHSFYANYQSNIKDASSNQFIISGPSVTTPATATATNPAGTGGPTTPSQDTGMSGTVLAGIIAGVVAVLILVALIFFCRHRRRVAVANKNGDSNSRSMDDNKEAGFTSGPGAYGSKKHQDKESLTRSAGSAGGPLDGGMVAVPLNGGPGARPLRPEENYSQGTPRSQPPMNHMQHSSGDGPSPTRNPFDGPAAMSPSSQQGGPGGQQALSRPHQYQPPHLPPNHQQSSPYGQQHQQVSPSGAQPYGIPNPLMAGQRAVSPYNRDSFESELESAYDPNRSRMVGGALGGRSNSNMRAPPINETSLSHSSSGRSINSDRYPNSMTPASIQQPQEQQQQTQGQNPFVTSQDHEIMAVAAAIAAAASPVQGNRQAQQQQQDSRGINSAVNNASPRIKEIEMQHLDIQQHQNDQQQKMMQRQQQQQQQQTQQQQQRPVQPVPLPAAQQSINPTQFDDKAELEEEEQIPVYNGYRDTIFGAYAQPQDGDEDDEQEAIAPVPALPAFAASPAAVTVAAPTTMSPPTNSNSNISQTVYAPAPGGAEIVRKKSVKFTGVSVKSGPIVLPNHEAAKEHQAQRQQQKQQQQHQDGSAGQAQHEQQSKQPKQRRPVSAAQYTENEDDDDFFDDDDQDFDEDEDDIKMRLMQTEAPSPVVVGARPYVNTTTNSSNPTPTVLSPVRSPDQHSKPYVGYPVPPAIASQRSPSLDNDASEDSSSSLENGFYEDVLAAVEKSVPAPPLNSLPSPTSSTTSPKSPKPLSPAGMTPYKKPPMPAVPRSPPSGPAMVAAASASASLPQQSIQQQFIPTPQPQHLMQPMNEQVYGAPSPRMTAASVVSQNKAVYPSSTVSTSPYATQQQQSMPSAGSIQPPTLSPRSKNRVPAAQAQAAPVASSHRDEDDDDMDAFYGGSIL
ncbi:hypothetical protein EDD11_000468 [Mortierella claussenii]|nr:hypothetical protein EDD11_000468 [Mortierella claussenii]